MWAHINPSPICSQCYLFFFAAVPLNSTYFYSLARLLHFLSYVLDLWTKVAREGLHHQTTGLLYHDVCGLSFSALFHNSFLVGFFNTIVDCWRHQVWVVMVATMAYQKLSSPEYSNVRKCVPYLCITVQWAVRCCLLCHNYNRKSSQVGFHHFQSMATIITETESTYIMFDLDICHSHALPRVLLTMENYTWYKIVPIIFPRLCRCNVYLFNAVSPQGSVSVSPSNMVFNIQGVHIKYHVLNFVNFCEHQALQSKLLQAVGM